MAVEVATISKLGSMIARNFKPARRSSCDPHRRSREEAKALAAQYGVEVEHLKDGGFNVWPPKGFAGEDPHGGDHFANDWSEVLPMVRAYAPAA